MAYAIDAQILIWGIKREATENRAHMIERARAFFQQCAEDKMQIFIPAQALGEALVDYDADKRRRTLAAIPKAILIAPLDAKAAAIAADLQSNWDLLKQLMQDFSIDRPRVKADINVLASAIAFGCSTIYSEDGQMSRLAQGRIIVKPLPVPKPPERMLFGGDES